VIAAGAAILGAVVGAGATYFGNRLLQESESEATARGIARVLEAQLQAAEGRFELALEENLVILPDTATTVSLTVEDEQVLASNLDSESWRKVALALLNLQLERQDTAPDPLNRPALEAHAGLHVPLTPQMRELDQSTLRSLRDGIEALEELS
jgi:hypothetical protein